MEKEMVRLQKYLADAGVGSRRACEKLIEAGKVKVNGRVVTEMGIKVDPSMDVVHYDEQIIGGKERLVYFMLNKPKGYITSASDEKGRKTVFDLIDVKERLFSIGRLDQMTSGMLLLTNDGDLAYQLTHPKHEITKTYMAEVTPPLQENDMRQLMRGVVIDGKKTAPCDITYMDKRDQRETYQLIIHEGRNRQVRKMFEAVGSQVVALKRTRIGDLKLSGLSRGQYRKLTPAEIRYLKGL